MHFLKQGIKRLPRLTLNIYLSLNDVYNPGIELDQIIPQSHVYQFRDPLEKVLDDDMPKGDVRKYKIEKFVPKFPCKRCTTNVGVKTC